MHASKDKLYFTDVRNRRVRCVDLTTGAISTVAGGGPDDPGDGGPALKATFSTHPMRVTLDALGDLFVTDAHKDSIRKIASATGIITRYAGNGTEAFAGDGGPATAACLAVPHAARFDRAGHLYIADTHNHRVRRVDGVTGVITTIAGTGTEGFSADGTPAAEAQLNTPLSVDIDAAGNIYIADTDNLRFRRIDAITGEISTVAGCGEMGPIEDGAPALEVKFARPRDVLVGEEGKLYLVDGDNASVCQVDFATGLIHRVAGCGSHGFSGDGGPATAAELNHCYSMAMDGAGNLYIKDSSNLRIRRVDQNGTISTIAGTGEPGYSGDGGPALDATLAIG